MKVKQVIVAVRGHMPAGKLALFYKARKTFFC